MSQETKSLIKNYSQNFKEYVTFYIIWMPMYKKEKHDFSIKVSVLQSGNMQFFLFCHSWLRSHLHSIRAVKTSKKELNVDEQSVFVPVPKVA
jgi:hypothetical protein